MRFEVICNNAEAFELAIARPSGEATRANYSGYIKTMLQKAAENEQEVISIQGVAEASKKSEMFQNVSFVEEAIMNHIKKNEYPKRIIIVCDSEEVDNMYRVVYNFYYADTKEARMDIKEDHNHDY